MRSHKDLVIFLFKHLSSCNLHDFVAQNNLHIQFSDFKPPSLDYLLIVQI